MKSQINTEVTTILQGIISEYIQLNTLPSPQNVYYIDFTATSIPIIDVPTVNTNGVTHLCPLSDARLLKANKLLKTDICTNAICYPPNSYMPWHTNSDIDGIRTYYIYSKKRSIFRYKNYDTNTVVDDEDNIGWTARTFKIDKQKPLWHTVWSEGYRFAFGFNSYNNSL